jgi:hypothetical protein
MTLFDYAHYNPAAAFERPADVLNCSDLSLEEKIEVLRAWEYDERLLEVAQEENMIGVESGKLPEILQALQQLHAEPVSGPTKSG